MWVSILIRNLLVTAICFLASTAGWSKPVVKAWVIASADGHHAYQVVRIRGEGSYGVVCEVYDLADPTQTHFALKLLELPKNPVTFEERYKRRMAEIERWAAEYMSQVVAKARAHDPLGAAFLPSDMTPLEVLDPGQEHPTFTRPNGANPTRPKTVQAIRMKLAALTLYDMAAQGLTQLHLASPGEVGSRVIDAAIIAQEMLLAQRAMQSQGNALHNDIKPQNVFVRVRDNVLHPSFRNGGVHIELGDFGFLGTAENPMRGFGSPGFRGPEHSNPQYRYDYSSDLYSTAATILNLLTGENLPEHFDAATIEHQIRSLEAIVLRDAVWAHNPLALQLWGNLKSFFHAAFQPNPENRPLAFAMQVTPPVELDRATGAIKQARMVPESWLPMLTGMKVVRGSPECDLARIERNLERVFQ